jgi:hypothetical protein
MISFNRAAKKFWIGVLVAIIFAVALVGFQLISDQANEVTGRVSDAAHKNVSPPYIHNGNNKPLLVAHPDEVIYVWNSYIRPSTCNITGVTLFTNPETKVIYLYSTFANWYVEGAYEFNEMFHIPTWMPPGHYHIVKKTINTCGSDMTHAINFDVEFDLKPL